MSKPKQQGIKAFLSFQEKRDKECVRVTSDGTKRICDICNESFFPQGWVQHRRSHPEVAKLYKMRSFGNLKVRGDVYASKRTAGE